MEPKDLLPPEDQVIEPSGPPSGEGEPPKETEPSAEERLAQITAENESLRTQMSELVKSFGRQEPRPPTYQEPPARREVTPPADVNFLEGVDVGKLFDDPEAVLNPLLNRVYQRGRESVMQDLPQLVQQHADQTYEVRARAKEFWDGNADLKPYQDFVGLVANQVANENPTWNIEQVYGETAKRTRERLGPILQQKPTDEPPAKPALPEGKSGGRKPLANPPKLNAEEQAMDAMWKEFGS